MRLPSDCLVVVPTYNERDNIAGLITALQRLKEHVDVLVVDDNSPDGTADIVRGLMKQHDGIYLLQRPDKQGLGNAYKAGFSFALRHGCRYICQMDADFSHDPNDITSLLNMCRSGADVAIGSRYIGGSRIVGWPWKRRLLSKAANLTAQALLKTKVNDLTGGFKCFNKRALELINPGRITSEGHFFQVEMNYRAKQENLNIRQLPVCFRGRRRGVSKMNRHEVCKGLLQLLRLAFNRCNKNKKRV